MLFNIIVALILLGIAIGAIYLLLKSMGEEGVEVAAPGSCKSGRCGVNKCGGRDEELVVNEVAPEPAETPARH